MTEVALQNIYLKNFHKKHNAKFTSFAGYYMPINYKKDLIQPYLSVNDNMTKISARVKDSKKIKRQELIKDIKKNINNKYDDVEEINVNGLIVLYINMLQ